MIIIILILVVVIPLAVVMSAIILTWALGSMMRAESSERHKDSELLKIAESESEIHGG